MKKWMFAPLVVLLTAPWTHRLIYENIRLALPFYSDEKALDISYSITMALLIGWGFLGPILLIKAIERSER